MADRERNFSKIQYEDIRKVVDAKFNTAHDDLTEKYYKHWRLGDFSADFRGYKPTKQEEAKPLFDKIHGLIFLLHQVALEAENTKQGNRYPLLSEKLDVVSPQTNKTRRQTVLDQIAALKTEGIELTP